MIPQKNEEEFGGLNHGKWLGVVASITIVVLAAISQALMKMTTRCETLIKEAFHTDAYVTALQAPFKVASKGFEELLENVSRSFEVEFSFTTHVGQDRPMLCCEESKRTKIGRVRPGTFAPQLS